MYPHPQGFREHAAALARLCPAAACVSAAFAAVIVAGLATGIVGIRPLELAPVLAAIVVCGAAAVRIRILGFPALADAIATCTAFFLLAALAALASAVLARISAPLADEQLVRLDRHLFPGFDWPRTMLALGRQPRLGRLLSQVYVSLNWQPELLFALLCLTGQARRSARVLSSLALALAISLAVFPFFPALGGYAHFAIRPDAVPAVQVLSAWQYPDVLQQLKSGHLDVLGQAALTGIVAMPSFHAASAIVLAWGFGSTRLRWPFAALNTAMWLSAVMIGGHYLVDVFAGSAVAALSLALSTPAPRRITLPHGYGRFGVRLLTSGRA